VVASAALALCLTGGCLASPPDERAGTVKVQFLGSPIDEAELSLIQRFVDALAAGDQAAIAGMIPRGWRPQPEVARTVTAYQDQARLGVTARFVHNDKEGELSQRVKLTFPRASLVLFVRGFDDDRWTVELGSYDPPRRENPSMLPVTPPS
jgi:hypothetical protein